MQNRPRKYILLLSIFWLACVSELPGGTSPKNIVASHVAAAPIIDGVLAEDLWRSAIPVSGFQQFDPDEGAPASEASTVRIVYDDGALYVGIMCYDADPPGIMEQISRRDRTVQADRFSVIIDSYHDHTTAFLFSGAVSGVQSDGLLSHDGLVYDVQWDAVWDFAAKVVPEGWSAEFKIPYSALRFSEQDSEYVWGINFRRFIARKKETNEWVLVQRSEVPPGTISSISKMGNLSGITEIHTPLHIELLPYHVSTVSFLAQPSPFSLAEEYRPNGGVDIKYGITNNFTLDVAVNPDFGQVEVDRANLNLTVFETYYPEKRPFFLEGSPIFSFGNCFDNKEMRLLYSRRIGRRPTRYDYLRNYDTFTVGENARYSQKPEVTTILAAGKLSGRTNDGLEIGVLTAVTDREDVILEGLDGSKSPSLMVEPRANYNVVRLRKTIDGGFTSGSVGIMGTGSMKERYLPSYTGGIDWKVRFDNDNYGIDGYFAHSSGASSFGDHPNGNAGRIAVGKLGGENWLIFSAYDFSTKKFFIDDLGFYSQPREHGGYAALSYKDDRANEPFRRYAVTLQNERRWNWNGRATLSRIEIEPTAEFRNFWQLNIDYYHDFPAYDDDERGISGLYRRPTVNTFMATLRTDSRKSLQFSIQSGYTADSKQGKTFSGLVESTIRPLTWLEFIPNISFSFTRKEEAWVRESEDYCYTAEGQNIFGDRNVDYYDVSLRATATFSNTISLQFFNQILFAKWRYTNLKKLSSPVELIPLPNQPIPQDYFLKIFNANIVFRWEYMPGSSFYIVWTQGRQGYVGKYTQNLSNDLYDVFRLPMDNVILAKISYWWSL